MRRLCIFSILTLFLAAPVPDSTAQGLRVGIPQSGERALEIVGRIQQDGPAFAEAGYVTHIHGVDDALLFTEGDPTLRSEKTARFTFVSSAQLTSRSVLGNIFVINATGKTDIYFSPTGGASFDNPASFTVGKHVATLEGGYQNILNVVAPNLGIATGVADLVQTFAEPFVLEGRPQVLGRRGLLQRCFYTGQGTRTDPAGPRATTVYGGHTVVTGQRGG